MPIKIYVGNYPLRFHEDDVLNLFQDYEGVELMGFFRSKNKCFSFLRCTSERQLVEIVTNLNAIDVCGRNLIVRAADEKFQKQIEESILKYGRGNFHPKDTTGMNSLNDVNEYDESFARAESNASQQSLPQQMRIPKNKNTYPKINQISTNTSDSSGSNTYNSTKSITKQNGNISNNYKDHDCSNHFTESDYSFQQINHSNRDSRKTREQENSNSDSRETGGYSQNLSEWEKSKLGPSMNPQESCSKFSKPKSEASAHYKTLGERFDSYKANSVYNRQNQSCADYQTISLKKQHHTRSRNASECSFENDQFDSYKADVIYDRENPSSSGYQTTNVREQYQICDKKTSDITLETAYNKPSFEKYESLSYISVLNFPLYLNKRSLYELFSDFNPLKILIVCNRPRMDKAPTEAIICFESEKDATNAILTMDNTVYQGRVLIVTDAVDMSLVSELLNFK